MRGAAVSVSCTPDCPLAALQHYLLTHCDCRAPPQPQRTGKLWGYKVAAGEVEEVVEVSLSPPPPPPPDGSLHSPANWWWRVVIMTPPSSDMRSAGQAGGGTVSRRLPVGEAGLTAAEDDSWTAGHEYNDCIEYRDHHNITTCPPLSLSLLTGTEIQKPPHFLLMTGGGHPDIPLCRRRKVQISDGQQSQQSIVVGWN